jgi:hypothetical protein
MHSTRTQIAACAVAAASIAATLAGTHPAAAQIDVQQIGGATLTGTVGDAGGCLGGSWTYQHATGAAFLFNTAFVWYEGPVTDAMMSGTAPSGGVCNSGTTAGSLSLTTLSGYFWLTTGHYTCSGMSGGYVQVGEILVGNVEGPCSINEFYANDMHFAVLGVLAPVPGSGEDALQATLTSVP